MGYCLSLSLVFANGEKPGRSQAHTLHCLFEQFRQIYFCFSSASISFLPRASQCRWPWFQYSANHHHQFMKSKKHIIVSGNQAAARMAYKTNEVCALYPITPSSEMSELVEQWSANQNKNIYGDVPDTFEMQSEARVAGAMHGA